MAAAAGSPGGSTSYPSHADGTGNGTVVSGGSLIAGAPARRARALWEAPPYGGFAGASAEGAAGKAVTVAEALAQRGGGTPWEDMPLSEEGRVPTSSGAPHY